MECAYTIDGGEMRLRCSGSGSPTVVFDSALGQGVEAWNMVAPAVAAETAVCVYDRKGVGASAPPSSRPHAPRQMARELEALLDRAGAGPPFVLVGHSIGGLTMQFFAKDRPADVAGMVLVEAAGDPMELWSLMPEGAIVKRRAELLASPEGLDLDTFVADAKAAAASLPVLGGRPLVIVTRGKPDAPPSASPEVADAWFARWRTQQALLRNISTNSASVVATTSGHMVPAEAPAVVIGAVRDVVRAVRGR
jgi:pimeloyl-ACP methyl ester carboxylesterase